LRLWRSARLARFVRRPFRLKTALGHGRRLYRDAMASDQVLVGTSRLLLV
jgi:hypothetical protein